MSELTLSEAQANLINARAALQRALDASAYSTSDRSLQRADPDKLRKTVGYWERIVNEMTAAQSGAANPTMIFPKWR